MSNATATATADVVAIDPAKAEEARKAAEALAAQKAEETAVKNEFRFAGRIVFAAFTFAGVLISWYVPKGWWYAGFMLGLTVVSIAGLAFIWKEKFSRKWTRAQTKRLIRTCMLYIMVLMAVFIGHASAIGWKHMTAVRGEYRTQQSIAPDAVLTSEQSAAMRNLVISKAPNMAWNDDRNTVVLGYALNWPGEFVAYIVPEFWNFLSNVGRAVSYTITQMLARLL